MSKALVLGIGDAQVDLLRLLKSKGWKVIGCGHRRQGKGLQWVDRFEEVDVGDRETLERIARREGVDLVYSIGSDLALSSIAEVSRNLGTPTFLNSETIPLFQNKLQLRDFLHSRKLCSLHFKAIREVSELDDWQMFPAVMKPTDNQGQRGIIRVDSHEELQSAFHHSVSFSSQGTVILEEFLEGPEVSVNLFTLNGNVIFSAVSDRCSIKDVGIGLPRGHLLPSLHCTGGMLESTLALAKECVQALKIENGPGYFQIKLTNQGPQVVEITPRLDGCHLWRLIYESGGPDLLEMSLRSLTGENLSFHASEEFSKLYLGFFLDAPGMRFQREKHSPPSSCRYLEYYYDDGEIIRPINGLMEKVGYYLEDLA